MFHIFSYSNVQSTLKLHQLSIYLFCSLSWVIADSTVIHTSYFKKKTPHFFFNRFPKICVILFLNTVQKFNKVSFANLAKPVLLKQATFP